MVLMAITGALGAGKTLSLTYLAYRNYLKGLKVYTNYRLSFPSVMVNSVKHLELMRQGFFAGDELWSWCDSRVSGSKRNRVVNHILLSSRKRGIHFAYTTQSFRQVDVRVRRVTDFIAIPYMSPNNKWCRLNVHDSQSLSLMKTFKFKTDKYFNMFSTNEEVKALEI